MSNKNEPVSVTGGCHCGHVRYEAEVFIKNGYACHCTICHKCTGQPAEISVPIRAGTLKFLRGEPSAYYVSDFGSRYFCQKCGSSIGWQATQPEHDWYTNLCVGSLDNPKEARITCHIYHGTHLPWYDFAQDLPGFSEGDPAMTAFIKAERNPEL